MELHTLGTDVRTFPTVPQTACRPRLTRGFLDFILHFFEEEEQEEEGKEGQRQLLLPSNPLRITIRMSPSLEVESPKGPSLWTLFSSGESWPKE